MTTYKCFSYFMKKKRELGTYSNNLSITVMRYIFQNFSEFY